MPRHKLFTEVESSPQFNSSLDESKCAEKKREHGTSIMTSKPGPSKTNTLQRESLHSKKMHPSCSEMDVIIKSPERKKNTVSHPSLLVSQKDSDLELCSDSDSDSMDISGFFSGNNQKLPYTYEEDEEILKYVLHGQLIFKVGSVLLWKDLERLKKNPKRSYQSLKNRFLRNIKPHLFTTYRHLIPDEETVKKILLKFPELKKQFGRQKTLTRIKLPKRNPAAKTADVNVSSTSAQDIPSKSRNSEVQNSIPDRVIECATSSSNSSKNGEASFHRKVEINGSSLTVLVNLKYKHPPPSERMGIYEKFEELKSKNNLIPCSACGRYGGPGMEENIDSGAESDIFISNSVKSKKSERSSRKEIVTRGRKRKKTNYVPESCNSQRSCSPSLLNDVNEVNELDDSTTGKGAEKMLEPAISVKEADSTPREPSPVTDKETDAIYENTVAEFRKLIDSDEEEVLVKKCLRKNRKWIGFDSNLSVDENHVDSYFVNSQSPDLESASVSDASAGSGSIRNKMDLVSPLAQNMMNMMENRQKIREGIGLILNNN